MAKQFEPKPTRIDQTIGFNVETVEYRNIRFTVWDIGGAVAGCSLLERVQTLHEAKVDHVTPSLALKCTKYDIRRHHVFFLGPC